MKQKPKEMNPWAKWSRHEISKSLKRKIEYLDLGENSVQLYCIKMKTNISTKLSKHDFPEFDTARCSNFSVFCSILNALLNFRLYRILRNFKFFT